MLNSRELRYLDIVCEDKVIIHVPEGVRRFDFLFDEGCAVVEEAEGGAGGAVLGAGRLPNSVRRSACMGFESRWKLLNFWVVICAN